MKNWLLLLVLVGILFAGCVSPPTKNVVHWHAKVNIEICGIHKDLPKIPPGQGHLGSPLLHTHDDNIVHLEGDIKNQDITIGKFMDVIGLDFSETSFMGKSNGDDCNGSPGKWKMFLNLQESNLFRDYVVSDGDTVLLTFE